MAATISSGNEAAGERISKARVMFSGDGVAVGKGVKLTPGGSMLCTSEVDEVQRLLSGLVGNAVKLIPGGSMLCTSEVEEVDRLLSTAL